MIPTLPARLRFSAAIALLLVAACSTPPGPAATAPARQLITKGDQLPRTSVALPVLPSELFRLPAPQLGLLLAGIESGLRSELERFEIRDSSTLDVYKRQVVWNGDVVSSRRVRAALEAGEMAEVSGCLGRHLDVYKRQVSA